MAFHASRLRVGGRRRYYYKPHYSDSDRFESSSEFSSPRSPVSPESPSEDYNESEYIPENYSNDADDEDSGEDEFEDEDEDEDSVTVKLEEMEANNTVIEWPVTDAVYSTETEDCIKSESASEASEDSVAQEPSRYGSLFTEKYMKVRRTPSSLLASKSDSPSSSSANLPTMTKDNGFNLTLTPTSQDDNRKTSPARPSKVVKPKKKPIEYLLHTRGMRQATPDEIRRTANQVVRVIVPRTDHRPDPLRSQDIAKVLKSCRELSSHAPPCPVYMCEAVAPRESFERTRVVPCTKEEFERRKRARGKGSK